MFDRIFSAVLAFCVLAAGTLAIGAAILERQQPQPAAIHLPRVEVDGKRADAGMHAQQLAVTQAPRTL